MLLTGSEVSVRYSSVSAIPMHLRSQRQRIILVKAGFVFDQLQCVLY